MAKTVTYRRAASNWPFKSSRPRRRSEMATPAIWPTDFLLLLETPSWPIPIGMFLSNPIRSRSVPAGQFGGALDAFDSDHVRRRAQRYVFLLCGLPNVFERITHPVIQFLPHAIQWPLVVLAVLDPFEIADRYPARVGQDVWNDGHAAFVQPLVGQRIDRPVGCFDDHRRVNIINVVFVDHATQCRWDQHMRVGER